MGRKVAVAWHASFSIAAGVLYFFFVLPRWPELTGGTSHTLGTVLRIVTGALIGLAALPVVFTLQRTRRPELGTPQLALTLRTSSIGLHVLAGVLIIGTAVSEIWLTLDNAGRWLFGIYGAAAAIALLGVFAFYLSFVAEMPPPPPKPLKPKAAKESKGRRGRRKAAENAEPDVTDPEEAAADDEDTTDDGPEPAEVEPPAEAGEQSDEKPAEITAENPDDDADVVAESEPTTDETVNGTESSNGGLRNRRQSGKMSLRRRKRSRGGVAVDD